MRPSRIAALLGTWLTLCAQAAVVPYPNAPSDVFLDAANGLLWSQPGAIPANTFASAQADVQAASFGGFSDWYLPSIAQFRALYRTQGTVPTGDMRPDYDEIMVEAPFSGMLPTWYWTTDVFPDVTSQNYAFSPTDENTQPYFHTTAVNVWAVHDYRAVSEPSSIVLLGLGMLAVAGVSAGVGRRRRGGE